MILFWPFLASNTILAPFSFVVILSWEAPIMAPFETNLGVLKSCFADWGTYKTLVSFTVCPDYNFTFTDTFSLHFIFWAFLTVVLIFHFSTYVMFFFLYVMFDDATMSPNHYLIYSLLFSSCTSPHNVYPTKMLLTIYSFSLHFFSKHSTALWPLFPKFLHSPLKRVFLEVLLLFLL